ncbi:lactate utilization protein B/C [Patiriisocius marinus]|uniref:Lactate utilization protein B/C n=1 Tax=Patiriisocius marinus TaxID=1397112 RepID=A0A5J4J5M9_9FLAO|nr:lactate utilization protein B/C [Patiriisocius marinus]GER59777.1 hypothetical protein ULMA_18850 [Patiriisocius marinus]
MSLFDRLFKGITKSDNQPSNKGKGSSRGKYYPEENSPIDEKFTYNFNRNGGKFLYCENMAEVSESFDNILLENDWYENDVFCIDETLKSKFTGYNLNFIKKTKATFFLTRCESLVCNNGSILLSSRQIKEKKLDELPSNIVVFATTSQFTENISEGLRIIKNTCDNFIPSNITTIQDFETGKEKDFMSYGSSTKNLYLLLLEDL